MLIHPSAQSSSIVGIGFCRTHKVENLKCELTCNHKNGTELKLGEIFADVLKSPKSL